MSRRTARVLPLFLLAASAIAADVPGSKDPPGMKRYEGSELIGYRAPRFDAEAAVKRIESTGVSFEERWRELGDTRVYHELGHIYSTAYGIAVPNRWMGELLANYLMVAYTSEHRDAPLARFRPLVFPALLDSLAPEHASLEDFERRYLGVGPSIAWYQVQLVQRAAEVYPRKKLAFLKEVKAAFPPDEKRPVPVDVSLERLEKISPGFLAWARRLESPP